MATICVSGTIGAGKTTLMKFLSEETYTLAYYEGIEENPILPLMYKNPNRWAFTLQMGFLQRKFEIMQEASFKKIALVERTIYEDRLFSLNHKNLGAMGEVEWNVYEKMYQSLTSSSKNIPSLTIFLDISDDLMLKRIRERHRPCEQGVDVGYYQSLNRLYRNFMAEYPYNKIIINAAKIDYNHMVDLVYETERGKKYVHQKSRTG